MKPKTNLLYWPKNRYVNSVSTNVAETFKPERERLALQQGGTSCRVTSLPHRNRVAI